MEFHFAEFNPEPPGPRDNAPIPLVEGKTYRLELGMKRSPRVLLLWAPRIVMPENELRAKCVVIDPGDAGVQPGAHIEPLAHCFRNDS